MKISFARWSTSEAWVVDDLWDLIEPLLPPWPDKAPGSRSAPDEVYAPTVGGFLPGFAALPPSAFGDSAVGADAIDGIRAVESRLAELEKSAQRGRLAQQH
ncbi:hypothetical protein [Streptosporangium sp. NPDC049644]|uniref:hypothetical protein n=1 Tax=Streptosporangium sp. NPDC049644 TaxID=3155507 RepID=UPI0034463D7F